jgi:ribosomal protein L37E
LKKNERNTRTHCRDCGNKLDKKNGECSKCGEFSEEKYHSHEELETHASQLAQRSLAHQGNQKLSEGRIKRFEEFIFENKAYEYAQKALKKGVELVKEIKQGVKRESKETKEAAEILQKMVMGKEVTEDEKKFLKYQSIDLLKVLPLIAIQGIPSPIPITPLLIILRKKYGFNVLPDTHDKIKKDN